VLTDWHRWLAVNGEDRARARAVTGAANLAFLGLAISGVYLWWPRQWTFTRLKSVTVFDTRLRGRARDFNWHNTIGFWTSAVLVVLTASGAVISYPWATRLVHRLAATPLPASPPRAGAETAQGPNNRTRTAATAAPEGQSARGPATARLAARAESVEPATLPPNLDGAWSEAERALPTWSSIAMRLGPGPDSPISFTITDGAHWNRFARSQLSIDGASGEVVRWEPYAASTRGQKVRGWLRFAHTGELGGVAGQAVAGAACVGGALLVWTGFALALRRFAAWRSVRSRIPAHAA
jgi:uncharacterized iron-regulated membrane protein